MNIVYGGSFNPVTTAHVKIIEILLNKFKPDNLIIVPVGNFNYHKDYLAPFDSRVEMINLCIKDYSNVFVSSIEKEIYKGTYNTLKLLSHDYKDIHFALGSDNALNISKWIKSKQLVKRYSFIIIMRDNISLSLDKNMKYDLINENIEGSSTHFRSTFDKTMVTSEVYNYVYNNNLYNIRGENV